MEATNTHKTINLKRMNKNIAICGLFILAFTACKRDKYYKDGGLAQAKFPGNMVEYLDAHPVPFDTIAQIVRLAGLEEMFSKDTITFFAPDDEVIKNTIGTIYTDGLNRALYFSGKDTVKELSEIDPAIWRKYLLQYVFRGANMLKDYPQIDFERVNIYPGALYYNLAGNVMNIGVKFGDANGIKYLGYRQLVLSYIPDISRPDDNWQTNDISSSDIQPTNGVVHALKPSGNYFGFNIYNFFTEVYNAGLK
jgi:hypothetical protein